MALYQEAERNAADGSPMMAVIHGEPVGEQTSFAAKNPAYGSAGSARPSSGALITPPAAIVGRFDELKQLAEKEALSSSNPSSDAPFHDDAVDTAVTSDDELIASIRSSEALGELKPSVEEDGFEEGLENPLVELSAEPLEVSTPQDKDEAFLSEPMETEAEVMNLTPPPDQPATTLPHEPPAPQTPAFSASAADDLDIADINSLVQQAWEDETAIGTAADRAETAEPSRTIETAMDEIAAAVTQSSDTAIPDLNETVKADIAATIRSELQAEFGAEFRNSLHNDLRKDLLDEIQTGLKHDLQQSLKDILATDLPAMVRSAVTDAVADALPANPEAVDEAKTSSKAAPRAANKKRTTAKKKAAPRTRQKKAPPDLG